MGRQNEAHKGLAIALTLIASLSRCRREAPTPQRHTAPSTQPTTRPRSPASRPSIPPGRGAQVIVDISQSLAGFTASRAESHSGRGRVRWREGGSTRMSALHQQVIERALAQLGANAPFQRCLLDATIHCDGSVTSAALFDDPATYRGADAALDSVLRRPPAVARTDARARDPLDDYAITVMLTDGFQSTVTPSPDSSPDVQCAGGADPACLGALLAARAREGYGVWIGRVVMPFAGTYYPERPVDEVWARIEAHVADLNTNHPEWTGVTFAARHGRRGVPSGAFRWEGARPLLMLVLSRDLNLGRNFVARVRTFLPNEPSILARGNALDVDFSELSPFEAASARIREDSIRRAHAGGAASAVRIAPAIRTPQGVQVSIRCPLQGVASFPVNAEFTRPAGIPAFVTVTPSWRVRGAAAPWLSPVSQPGPPGQLNLSVGVDCRRLAQGDHSQTLGVYVDWRRNPLLNQEWYMRDSVETSYEAPERVYRLREIVTPPLVAATDRRGWLDALHVTLHRE